MKHNLQCEYCENRRATTWSDEGRAQCAECAPPAAAADNQNASLAEFGNEVDQ